MNTSSIIEHGVWRVEIEAKNKSAKLLQICMLVAQEPDVDGIVRLLSHFQLAAIRSGSHTAIHFAGRDGFAFGERLAIVTERKAP